MASRRLRAADVLAGAEPGRRISSGSLCEPVPPRSVQQAGDTAAAGLGAARGRLGDGHLRWGEDFEQRRFPRVVAADDTDDLALLHLEGDVLERPEVLGGLRIVDCRLRIAAAE